MSVPCQSLAEVRAHIDRLDRAIVPLLAERAGYVAQAAGFKTERALVVDVPRIEQIVAKVRALAEQEGTDPALIEAIYRAMIDAFIAFENTVWDKDHTAA